jgi:hypothetical protein
MNEQHISTAIQSGHSHYGLLKWASKVDNEVARDLTTACLVVLPDNRPEFAEISVVLIACGLGFGREIPSRMRGRMPEVLFDIGINKAKRLLPYRRFVVNRRFRLSR